MKENSLVNNQHLNSTDLQKEEADFDLEWAFLILREGLFEIRHNKFVWAESLDEGEVPISEKEIS